MQQLLSYATVFLGAGIGGALRHGVNQLSLRLSTSPLPVGTFAINIAGSFAIGALAAWLAMRGHAGQRLQLFLVTGILGGFTTFSAFSLENALMLERGEIGAAALYAVGSVVVGIGAVFAGLAIVRA